MSFEHLKRRGEASKCEANMLPEAIIGLRHLCTSMHLTASAPKKTSAPCDARLHSADSAGPQMARAQEEEEEEERKGRGRGEEEERKRKGKGRGRGEDKPGKICAACSLKVRGAQIRAGFLSNRPDKP